MRIKTRDFGSQDLNPRKLHNIDEIVFIIDEAEKNGRPKPIVLIGAGTSVTSGIPLANSIKDEVFQVYKDKPVIKSLDKDATYYETMKCLSPMEKNFLFKKYFEQSKINISNLLLSNLLKHKKLDYVLSVNFDDLLIRASALLGFAPSFYDIANIRDFTTTNFPIGSVIYLHGFQYSSWLLNTREEFNRVEKLIPQLFSRICNDRAWIIVGYSGQDPVFKHLCELGRFDNNLYWVCFENNLPCQKVREMNLESEEKNAYFVYGYNSDSFLLDLHYGLRMKPPDVLLSPFSYLKELYQNLSVIEYVDEMRIDSQNQRVSLYYLVENSKKRIEDAIKRYEKEISSELLLSPEEFRFKSLIYIMMECTLTHEFDSMEKEIEEMLTSTNEEFRQISSHYYTSWGNFLLDESRIRSDVSFLDQAMNKYEKAYKIDPKNELALSNWALTLQDKARLQSDTKFYHESFNMLNTFVSIQPDSPYAYFVWARGLEALAKLTNKRSDYSESVDKFSWVLKFEPNNIAALIGYAECSAKLAIFDLDKDYMKDSEKKYQRASEKEKNNDSVSYSWGNSLYMFGKSWKNSNEYLEKSLEKFEEATFFNPRNFAAFNNWGNALLELAVRTGNRKTFCECFQKYERCTKIREKDSIPLTNWGNALMEYARSTGDKYKIEEALSKYETAYEIDSKDQTNLVNWGNALRELGVKTGEKMYFKKSIEKFEEARKIDSMSFNLYMDWGSSLYNFFEVTKDELTIKLAIEKFKEASKINPDDSAVYSNIAESLRELGKLKKEEKIYLDAIQIIESAENKNLKNSGMYNTWGSVLYEIGIEFGRNDRILDSVEKFKKSLELNQENDSAYFNSGLAYLKLYDTSKSEDYLRNSISSFEQSLTINPENMQFKKKSMIVLSKLRLAENTNDCELYQLCFRNLEQLFKEKPDDVELLNTWSSYLIRYSRIIDDIAIRNSILNQAKEIAFKAMKLGGSAYNLACCHALLGNEMEAFAYLSKSLRDDNITVNHILEDEDWKDYKDNDDFLKIINE